jgi:hypothetical protein
MNEEDLMMKLSIHINMNISINKHEEHQTIKHQSDNGVRQSRLHLRAFVSVGEAFLFLFKDLKLHHNSAKRIKN